MIVAIVDQSTISLHHSPRTVPENAMTISSKEELSKLLDLGTMTALLKALLGEECEAPTSRSEAIDRLWMTLISRSPVQRVRFKRAVTAFGTPRSINRGRIELVELVPPGDPVTDLFRSKLQPGERKFLKILEETGKTSWTRAELGLAIQDRFDELGSVQKHNALTSFYLVRLTHRKILRRRSFSEAAAMETK